MQDAASNSNDGLPEEDRADGTLRNANEDDIAYYDQDWDIRSPLIPKTPIQNLFEDEQAVSSLQIDGADLNLQGDDDSVDPYTVFLETCSFVTMILFFGLTTGSFFYPWFDTKLKLLLDQPTAVELPFDVDVDLPMFVDTTFAKVFEIFKSSLHSMYAVRTICVLSFIIPSLCFASQLFYHVVLGSLPLTSYKEEVTTTTTSSSRINGGSTDGWQILKSELCAYWHSIAKPRQILKWSCVPLYFVKFSMIVAYVILVHEVVLAHVHFAVGGDFSPKDSTVLYAETTSYLYARVVNEIRGGFVAYMLGVLLGSYSLMVLKARFQNKCRQDVLCIERQSDDESSNSLNESTNTATTPFFNQGGSFVSPPQWAFRMMPTYDEINGGAQNESYEAENHDDGISTPLLRHLRKEVENHPLQQIKSERNRHGRENATLDNLEVSITSTTHKVCWRDIFIFEICLLSVVLVLPLFSEPLVSFHYVGALTHIFEDGVDQVFTCTFWDLIMAITKCGDKGVFSVIVAVVVWLHVVILPFMCWICHSVALCCMAIGRYTHYASKFMVFTTVAHPLHHIAPFAMGILVASWFMGDVSNFLLDQNTLCGVIQSLVNNDIGIGTDSECLRIQMTLHPAIYLLLSQAFTMDTLLFIIKEI